MPEQSRDFDCDDAVLLMYDRFSGLGIETAVVAGNLDVSGEELKNIDHVWLLAEICGWKIPFDWGLPRIDRQHYEGYLVNHAQLLKWVEHDRRIAETALR